MLTEPNVSVKHEDLGDALTMVDPAKKAFTTMVPKGPKPKDTIFFDTIDKEESPRMGGVSDGSSIDRTNLENPAANHGKIGGRIQVHQRTLGVGFIAASVTDPAGVPDWYAKGVTKKLSEVKGDMEMTYLSTQESRDSTTLGSTVLSDLTRGAGRYISNDAPLDAAATVPEAYRTPAAQIKAVDSVADFTLAHLDAMMMSAHISAGGGNLMLNGFLSPTLLQRVQSFFKDYKPEDGSLPLAMYTQDGAAPSITHKVTRYTNVWGTVDMMPCHYLGGHRQYTGVAGLTASITNTSTAVSLGAAFRDYQAKPGLQVGMRVYGTGIAEGTYITAINENGQGFTLSIAATATNAAATLYFGELVHGYLNDMRTWEQRPSLTPGHTNLSDEGAGKQGFIRAIAGLRCTNPLHNCKIHTLAAAES